MAEERYFIKKQQKEQDNLRRLQRKKIKKILAIFVPALLIIGGSVIWINNSVSQESQAGTPIIEISPKEYDAGDVSMAAGLVKRNYEIKNIGSGNLKIDDIWTSCHCTTAVLKVAGKESPEFGMDHAGFWSQVIAPGETGQLEVTFDPAFHGPQGIGPAVREIYLSTNDFKNNKAVVRLTVNVIE